MTENLPDTVTDTAPPGPVDPPGAVEPASEPAATRPDFVPEKFWDAGAGEVRVDALAKSYAALESKLGARPGGDLPDGPDGYDIAISDGFLENDPQVNAVLHEAGLTNEQAQLVYDLAAERLMPLVTEIGAHFQTQRETERLVEHFGGDENWRQTRRQLTQWGKANLPDPVYDALSLTAEGVAIMHRMMANGEPTLLREGAPVGPSITEADVDKLMSDPRYWRDRDPVIVEKVRDGIRRLHGE